MKHVRKEAVKWAQGASHVERWPKDEAWEDRVKLGFEAGYRLARAEAAKGLEEAASLLKDPATVEDPREKVAWHFSKKAFETASEAIRTMGDEDTDASRAALTKPSG
jgi:hypothetical protein